MQPLKEELPVVRPAPLREQRKAVTVNPAITIKTRSRRSPITLFTQLVALDVKAFLDRFSFPIPFPTCQQK